MDNKKINSDDAAFPHVNQGRGYSHGMSKRDWFAGMALQGILASGAYDLHDHDYADKAYKLADAMIKKRGK